VGSKILVMP